MNKPLLKIALVGRPNVGKSALFNAICGKRIAIVDEQEGVTRDRLYAPAECFGRYFEIVDTGGLSTDETKLFQPEIQRQTQLAIEEADSIIQVVDARVGVTSYDEEVSKMLLKTQKPLCLAVNKIDHPDHEALLYPFYSLGIEKIVSVSAIQQYQLAELIETALGSFSEEAFPEELPITNRIKVAMIGRPNVGKSTLMNMFLDEERCAVSPIAGTTRDSIDVDIDLLGVKLTLIDTAGIRRKKKEENVVEKFASIRTERAIERADVCLVLIDAEDGITAQEKHIVSAVERAGKGCIVLANKWDLVKGFRMEHCAQGIRMSNPFLLHCPIIFTSAKTGRNVDHIISQVETVYKSMYMRISTGKLNRFIESAMQRYHPPMIQGKRLRVYYMTQVTTAPVRFVLFVNDTDLMTEAYKRYVLNQLREVFGYVGCPVYLELRGKEREPTVRHESYRAEPVAEVL